jgi:pimeloyl-ACP methyl ester carboxylesterase
VPSIIAYDFLGFGFSDKPKYHNYTVTEQAIIAEQLYQYLDISAKSSESASESSAPGPGSGIIDMLAHDLGDTVLQEVLARDNIPIRSAAFLNGGLFAEMHRPKVIQKVLLNKWLGPYVSKFMCYRLLARNLGAVFGEHTKPTLQLMSDFWHLITFNGGHSLYHRLIHYITDRSIHRDRWARVLDENSMPNQIAIINGPADPISGRHMVEHARKVLKSTPFIYELHPSISHYPQCEDPSAVFAALEKYWGQLQCD